MNITYAQAINDDNGTMIQIKAEIDGKLWFVTPNNEIYDEIMSQVNNGTLTIDPLVQEVGE